MSERRYRPYPAYKDSGVEWLGRIPEGWEEKPLRRTVLDCQNGVWGDEPDGVHDVVCVRVADFDRITLRAGLGDPTLRSVQEDIASARLLHSQDLLLEKSGGGERQPVGAVVLFDGQIPAVCSNFVARLRIPRDCAPRFLTYLHATLYLWRINTRHIKQSTGIQNLDSPGYLSEGVAVPPLAEQRAIAAFLDRETARIDALVARKGRLVGLLQEKRTALIARAVTKGLDPGVQMKDSGVEWLGDIPEQWEAKKIKRLCLVRRGASPRPIDDPIYFDEEGEYSWVRIADVTASGRYLETTTQRLSPVGQAKSVALEPGELFVSIAATVGRPIVTKIKCCIHDGFVYFVGLRQYPDFLYYAFACGEPYGGLGKLGTQLNLNTDTIGEICLPVPPLPEQRAIAIYLDRETARIDALLGKVRRAIDLLKEHRTALISAAVTGKIDVRGETA